MNWLVNIKACLALFCRVFRNVIHASFYLKARMSACVFPSDELLMYVATGDSN